MSRINKVKVDNVIYDIEDAEARDLINSLQTDFDGIKIPTKLSELENDDNYIKSTENAYFPNGVRMYNHNTQSDGRKVDLLVEHIQGVGYGGYEDDLHLNHRSSNDVRILEEGTGTLYYKGNEVADREYVDEKIADIEISGGGITEIPIASATTLGGIKVGANLTIDEDGTLNASASGGSGSPVNIDALPIGSVILYDGDEIPEGYEEVEDYEPTYSLEETKIGTWLGKPLYRKVVQYTLTATDGYPNFDTGIRDIEYAMIDMYKSDGGDTNTNYFRPTPAISGYLNKSNGLFTFILVSGTEPFKASTGLYTFIIKYIKTTDEGV